MPYDLGIQGLKDFHRIDGLLAQRKIPRDPLSGVVNGINKIFYTNYFPILSSGSLTVYDSAGSTYAGTVDLDTGEVEVVAAPSNQLAATYAYTPYTVAVQLGFLISGFQVMESFWPRGFRLLDSGGNPADEDSDALIVDDGSGGDPFTGKATQLGLFVAACRYTYLLTLLTGAANTDYAWRETARGMSVDKSRRPGNLAQAVETAKALLDQALGDAQIAWYNGDNLGAFVGNPVTEGYALGLEWQTASKNGMFRNLRGSRNIIALSV